MICSKCGSELVIVAQTVKESANPLYPITVTKYRCTNDECQAETDRKQAEIAKQKLEREERANKHRGIKKPE